MTKYFHEIRDPIHTFVRLDSHERQVLNSRPFQRLRHIHQLALTYLVYPGATHKRFEHSLGVMELAGRVFDVVTDPRNKSRELDGSLRPLEIDDELKYWRRVVRMAALCHDIGHLPFSHAAEKELLPAGWDHERLTRDLINSNEMMEIWRNVRPPLDPSDIVKLAVGPKKAKDLQFSDWEAILSEIIVGDAFGVDRMDYLLRDSYHAGVAYGRFDHYRLVDSLRILPSTNSDSEHGSCEPALGIEEGGVQSAEALMLARYFMYSQVYFHPVRRIYDIHLKDFLQEWLPGRGFSTDLANHLAMTDNEVTAALLKAAFDPDLQAHTAARRVMRREHFKLLYERNPDDVAVNPEAGRAVYERLCSEFGADNFRHDAYVQKSGSPDFPVRMRDRRIASSLAVSDALRTIPIVSVDYVFVNRDMEDLARRWVSKNRAEAIKLAEEGRENG